MRQDIRVLDRVRGAYASLRPSEQRVADYVLKDPETCTRCTISELADQVQVSQPTVIRFVQALGFDGYRNSNTASSGTAAAARPGRPASTTWEAST